MEKRRYDYYRRTSVYNGVRYEAYGKSLAEANRKLDKKIKAAMFGQAGSGNKISVSEWADAWLRDYVQPKVREPGTPRQPGTMGEKNYSMYETVLRVHVLPSIGKHRLSSVTEQDLRAILNRQRGKSFSNAQKIRFVLQAMFRQARAARIIEHDPAEFLDLPLTVKGKGRALTAAERAAFDMAVSNNKHGVLFQFLLATGLRPGECAALTVGSVDLNKCLVHVTNAVESGTKVIGSPKTKAGERYTVINDLSLLPKLKSIMAVKADDDFLFTQTDGKSMLTETCIRRYWDSLKRQMEIELGAKTKRRKIVAPVLPDDLVIYCLRHTFGTDMQRKGVPIDITKYLMGHEDITTTANIYVDSGKEEAIRAISILSSV